MLKLDLTSTISILIFHRDPFNSIDTSHPLLQIPSQKPTASTSTLRPSSSHSPTAPSSTLCSAPSPPSVPLVVQITKNKELENALHLLKSDHNVAHSAQIISKLLTNILNNPHDDKYRKIRLTNPKIQSAIVDTHGGIETLLACGFSLAFETIEADATNKKSHEEPQEEGFAVLDHDADLDVIQEAISVLHTLLLPHAPLVEHQPLSTGTATSDRPSHTLDNNNDNNSSNATTSSLPTHSTRQAKDREWDPPCNRNTRVILPVSIATDVPEWFFQRTGSELKAAFLSSMKKREESQLLMTRQMRDRRERARQAISTPATGHAIVKVRLPEGLCIQGEFGQNEPVVAIFGWLADCLEDPMQTYELVLPDRAILQTGKAVKKHGTMKSSQGNAATVLPQSVKEAGLLPSVTLNLRWTGDSAQYMKTVPALKRGLMMDKANDHECTGVNM